MLGDLYRTLPPEGVKIALVLFLAFLLGLDREERKTTGAASAFGGVRTFPLIGLIGYATKVTVAVFPLAVPLSDSLPTPASVGNGRDSHNG